MDDPHDLLSRVSIGTDAFKALNSALLNCIYGHNKNSVGVIKTILIGDTAVYVSANLLIYTIISSIALLPSGITRLWISDIIGTFCIRLLLNIRLASAIQSGSENDKQRSFLMGWTTLFAAFHWWLTTHLIFQGTLLGTEAALLCVYVLIIFYAM